MKKITIDKDMCDSREQIKANLGAGFHLILGRNGHSGETESSQSTINFESGREPQTLPLGFSH